MNVSVGRLHRFPEPEREQLRRRQRLVTPRIDHVFVDRLGGHLAGDLTRRGAPHAVGHHHEGTVLAHVMLADVRQERRFRAREIGDEKAVLVVLARAAQIGLAEHLDLGGPGGASEHAHDWQSDCTRTGYERTAPSRVAARRAHSHPCARSSSLAYALATRYAASARSLAETPGVLNAAFAESRRVAPSMASIRSNQSFNRAPT